MGRYRLLSFAGCAMIVEVVFIVLMLFWLCGGGYWAYSQEKGGPILFGAGTLIPWFCVALLGYAVFNGTGATVVQDRPIIRER